MIDENGNTINENTDAAKPVAFCQDCGRPLTAETMRTVGSGVFCEPCLERRVAGAATASATATGATATGTVPPNAVPVGAVPVGTVPAWYGRLPSPVLAGLLGFIPGVGAMYNGQFAKGIAHIIIFSVLSSLSHNVSDMFGLFVAGWIFYMAFEAYHTAKARMMGMPLPDPLGLNNIGERFGVPSSWNNGGWQHTPPPPPPAWTTEPIITPPPASTDAAATNDWASVAQPVSTPYTSPYAATPPRAFDASYAAPPTTYATPPPPPTAWHEAPPVYGATATPIVAANLAATPPTSRFPAGAIWMIGLGAMFLILTLGHDRINFFDVVPFFLAALSVWIFIRKMIATGGLSPDAPSATPYITRALDAAGGAFVLFVIAVLLGLQAFASINFGRTWPVLLIAIGIIALARRTSPIVATPMVTATMPFQAPAVSVVPQQEAAEPRVENQKDEL